MPGIDLSRKAKGTCATTTAQAHGSVPHVSGSTFSDLSPGGVVTLLAPVKAGRINQN